MATLVLDIETIGEDWEHFDAVTTHALTRWIERSSHSREEYDSAIRDLKEGLGFSPLTGSIVAIGLYDLERSHGVVYYQDRHMENETDAGAFVLKPRTEKEMLEDFWEGAKGYDTFVTFNGRSFDIPFLNLRSAFHGIRPTHDLMEGRYLYQQKHARHVDLQDQLTFYGAVRRRPSLHLFCRAFGIDSPKDEGVTGDDIAGLFFAKKYRDIAEYNARDVIATAELYRKWVMYLAPNNFLENIE